MLIGYARVSTEDQDLTLQRQALEAAGCERIYEDKKSGKNLDREGWKKARMDLRAGDTLVVWKLDRLGRNVIDLINLAEQFRDEGIDLIVLTQAIDTRTPAGRLMFNIMASFAEWERDMTAERTKAGMAAAKKVGRVMGGLPVLTPEIWVFCVATLKDDPHTSPRRLAEMVKEKYGAEISYGTFHKWRAGLEKGDAYPEDWRIRREQYEARQKELAKDLKRGKRRR